MKCTQYLYYLCLSVIFVFFCFGVDKVNAVSYAVAGFTEEINTNQIRFCIDTRSASTHDGYYVYLLNNQDVIIPQPLVPPLSNQIIFEGFTSGGTDPNYVCSGASKSGLITYFTTNPYNNYDLWYVVDLYNLGSPINETYYSHFIYIPTTQTIYSDTITTRIDSFTFSTTTQTARIQGYWTATTTPNITQRLEFKQFSTMFGFESQKELTATTTGLFDLTFDYKALPTPVTATTTAPFIADTTLFATIYEYNNNYSADPFTGIFDSRYKTLLVATTTTITALTGINIASTTGLFVYPEYECSITSITGCFKNALIWAFYPTQQGVEQYYSFIALIEKKAPIGYFFISRDAIQGLNKDSTPNTSINIPNSIRQYIFNPFDLAISGILWLFFLFNFYKRLKFITI